MTSLTKTTSINDEKQLIHFVGGPYYNDASSRKLLFPFTFKNGILEINLINGFSLTSGFTPLNFGSGGLVDGGLVRLHGGLNLVQYIGPNFKTYIKNCTWKDETYNYAITSEATVSVYTPGVVSRVQQLDNTTNLPMSINPGTGAGEAYVLSTSVPTEGFISPLPNFGVTYAFNKPLVVSATGIPTPIAGGTAGAAQTVYITFFSSWDR
jgi:hypothetical protein